MAEGRHVMKWDDNLTAFFVLLRSGLWEERCELAQYEPIDFKEVYGISEEQSVVGLIAAGLEHVVDLKNSQDDIMEFVGCTMQIEQRNAAMNVFVAELIEKLHSLGVYALLLKGQGLAQCYERPLWRACGDVDLLLSEDNYSKTRYILIPKSSKVDEEKKATRHLAMRIDEWEVELHGTLRGSLWSTINSILDDVQQEIFYHGSVHSWMNGKTQVLLPGTDEEVVYVFSHILEHFFVGGIGLRQVCDWCRLLWTYRDKIDMSLLEKRLQAMGVVTEWKAFASLAVDYLGMPKEAMPFYSSSTCWRRKAYRILKLILETGNFGQNRDLQYQQDHSFFVRKAISLWRLTWDSMRQLLIFPIDPIRVWLNMFNSRMRLLFQRNYSCKK